MLNLLSLIIGTVALVFVLIALIPILGLLNWLIIPFAVIGLALGAMSSSKSGRNLNIVVIVVGVVRLMITGGLF